MRHGRFLRLLLLALPLLLGLAEGAHQPLMAGRGVPDLAIRASHESLPAPVHDEATCAFCQAAIFPPCAPQPTDLSVAGYGQTRRERLVLDARAPRFTTHRSASSRAPPTLLFV